jgi:hypothetical protein
MFYLHGDVSEDLISRSGPVAGSISDLEQLLIRVWTSGAQNL